MTTALATPIKPRNPVLVWLVWPLLTLGIYFLVWYYKIHKEMAELRRDPEAPVVGPLLVMLLLSWTGIAAIISSGAPAPESASPKRPQASRAPATPSSASSSTSSSASASSTTSSNSTRSQTPTPDPSAVLPPSPGQDTPPPSPK